jgi:Ca-activated chloride channel family protein
MSFGHPLLLLALLLVPVVIGAYALAQRRRARYAVRFTNLDVLAPLVRGQVWRRHLPAALFLVAVGALAVAVARPYVRTLVPKENATVILVIDTSGSMQATDVRPTRLAAAQSAVREFLKRVPARVRVGLIAFAGDPQVATPPTTDHKLVRAAVDAIGGTSFGFFGGGTAIGDALAAAVELGKPAAGRSGETIAVRTNQAQPKGKAVTILFLSDGHQTRGDLEPLEGAARAKAAGIPVFTIALGTPNGVLNLPDRFGFGPRSIPVPPDPETLHAIARATGGEFFAARSARAVDAAYKSLGSRLGREPGKSEVTYAFLAGAAGMLLAAGLLAALWSPRLP